jgi:hypothetical protein
MTFQVYFQGDISNPHDCKIKDAATNQSVIVTSVQLTIEPNHVFVDMRMPDGTNQRAEVVSAPPPPPPPRIEMPKFPPNMSLAALSIQATRNPVYRTINYRLGLDLFDVVTDNCIRPANRADLAVNRQVDEFVIDTANDPYDMLLSEVQGAGAELGRQIAERLFKKVHPLPGVTKPEYHSIFFYDTASEMIFSSMAQSNALFPPSAADLLPPPIKVDDILNREDCPDCKGTGKYQGFFREEECSTCGGTGKVKKTDK